MSNQGSRPARWSSLTRRARHWLTGGDPRELLKDTQFPRDASFSSGLRWLRHPLRFLVLVLASVALTLELAPFSGLLAGGLGALIGLCVGEWLGRGSVRLPWAVVLGALICWSGSLMARWVLELGFIASTFGTTSTLVLSSLLRYGLGFFGGHLALRVLSHRKRWGLALEALFVVAALAVLFSAHRDGVISRPLWLSDWAWRQGIDPANVFLYLGATVAALLSLLLLFEQRDSRVMSSLLALPLLALLAVACLDVVGRPTPQAEDGLGLTTSEQGDPPPPLPPPPDNTGGTEPGDRDGGTGGGGSSEDAGTPEERSGDGDGGGAAEARDGGAQQGGQLIDGGGAAEARDGGSGGASSQDGGDGGGASPSDAGADSGATPAEPTDGGTEEAPQQAQDPPPDGGTTSETQGGSPPPPSELLQDEDSGPSKNPAPLAVVVFDNDYSPPSGAYYFRQEAWSAFNGTRLLAPEQLAGGAGDASALMSTMPEKLNTDVLDDFPEGPIDLPSPPAEGRIRVKARAALLVDHQQPFALESPVRFEPSFNPDPDRFARTYRFESLAQKTEYRELLGRSAGNPDWSDEVREHYLITHPDPRFKELVDTIIEDGELPEAMRKDPFARALALKLWLDHNLIYSTKERHNNVPDPTLDFLFGNRTGYCVHFAHAAVFLLRATGVPARIGTGYMVAEENRRGGSAVLLRSNDAHAWPELYLAGVGWIVFDIAAETNLDEPGQPLDEELQRMLGEMARDEPPDPADQVRNDRRKPSALWAWLTSHVWHLLAGLILIILAVLYGTKAARRLSPAFSSKRRLPVLAYRTMLDRLAEVGHSRRYGETREAFARRVVDVAPSLQEATALLVESHLSRTTSEDAACYDRTRWRLLRKSSGQEIRGHVRWWRRLLGLLHPVSFLNAK